MLLQIAALLVLSERHFGARGLCGPGDRLFVFGGLLLVGRPLDVVRLGCLLVHAIGRVVYPVPNRTLLLVVLQITVVQLFATLALSGLLVLVRDVLFFVVLAQDIILIVHQILHSQLVVVVELLGFLLCSFALWRLVDFDVTGVLVFLANVFAAGWLLRLALHFAPRRDFLILANLAILVTHFRLFVAS